MVGINGFGSVGSHYFDLYTTGTGRLYLKVNGSTEKVDMRVIVIYKI